MTKNSHGVVVMINKHANPYEIESLSRIRNVLVSITISMYDPITMCSIANVVRSTKKVIEMVLISDPTKSMVRIRNAV